MIKARLIKTAGIIFLGVTLAGCTFIFQSGRRSDIEKIGELSSQLNELNNVRNILEQKLAQEIKDKQLTLKMQDKGLVITVLADLLFDSGKDKIKQDGYAILSKVGFVLRENVPQFNVGIEGHTDNEPIRFSGWKSNWELSAHRALSVLGYLIEKEHIAPERLSAIGYGEFHPVAGNLTREGRQLNRRVEIVILPQLGKVKAAGGVRQAATAKTKTTLEPQESAQKPVDEITLEEAQEGGLK
jgi:flagellar motor protein MotB